MTLMSVDTVQYVPHMVTFYKEIWIRDWFHWYNLVGEPLKEVWKVYIYRVTHMVDKNLL